MSSLAKMKAELNSLEDQKTLLLSNIARTGKQFKVGLWLMGGGITLIPLYGSGLILLVAGGIYAFVNNERRNIFRDTLEDVENHIHKLEESMG